MGPCQLCATEGAVSGPQTRTIKKPSGKAELGIYGYSVMVSG